ncbi:MAG: hypothetical protein Q9160_002945 [Pyrenula sp. 1 TL-2023]
MHQPPGLKGWTFAPDDRGTMDIIWSCVLVIFTAVWTVLHLNIPGPTDNYFKVLFRRLRWVTLAVLAPDMLTLTAASQWDSARKSVAEMRLLGYREWSMEHAFYANSGGFFIDAPDVCPFPAMATSIRFLLAQGYLEAPTITRAEIWDKSKSDRFAKMAALIQSGWLVFASISRLAQGLPLSPAEIFTLGFIVSTIMSYYFWLHKPQNAGTPTHLTLKCSMSDVIAKEKNNYPAAIEKYLRTPLDFIEMPAQRWHRRTLLSRFDLSDRPTLRVPDDANLPNLWGPRLYALVGIPSLLHSTIHLLAWNVVFPTRAEQLLWRSSALTLLIASSVSTGGVSYLMRRGYKGRLNLCWIWVNDQVECPDLEKASWMRRMRFRVLDVVFTLTTLVLVLARLGIILEVMISFRSLPVGVYTTVQWTNFIPHVG